MMHGRYKFIFDMTTAFESQYPKTCGKIRRHQNKFADFKNFNLEHPPRIKTTFDPTWLELPVFGITVQLTSQTTAVTHNSAGGVQRRVSSPSSPSTFIHPNLKLPPGALVYARAVLYDQLSGCECERTSLAIARRPRLAGSTCGLQVGYLKQALGGHDRNAWTRMHTRM